MKTYKNKVAFLGCGEYPMKGAVNVDVRALPGVDVVADVRKLPFKDGELKGIASRNLIEHFSRHEVAPMIQEWVRCIKKGGFIEVETVDMGLAMDNWRNIPEENLLDCMYGAETYDENFHKTLMTQEILARLFMNAGLDLTKGIGFVHREIPRMKLTGVKK